MNHPRDPHSIQAPALRNPNQESGAPRLRATPPAMPRRAVEAPNSVRRPPEPAARYAQLEGRRMVVAKEITLSGQISKCDHLIVEGSVENMRYDGQSLEVVEGGVFNGMIEVETAVIAGLFDGTMTVRGQLVIRASGRVTGTIRYGELEVNTGGQLNGELQSITARAERGGYRGGTAVGNSVESILNELQEDSNNVVQRMAAVAE